MPIDLNALAYFVETTFDYDEAYEDDCFAVTFQNHRIYVERKRAHFNLHIGAEVLQMPR